MEFAILGGGRWGIAIATALARKGHRCSVFDINQRAIELINQGQNPYWDSLELPQGIEGRSDIEKAQEFEILVCALPVQSVRDVFSGLELKDHIVINASKGLEIESFKRVSEIIREIHPQVRSFALSGPSFAREVAEGKPTALVLSHGGEEDLAKELQKAFNSENFRVYLSSDIVGVELGGALKNVMAIACGISDGLGYGHNARAGLITRALAEMVRIGVSLGARAETFYGLSGLGDLVLTATSDLSRNRTFGIMIGRGYSPEGALREIGQTVEGYKTALPLFRLTRERNIYAPITDAVYSVLYDKRDLKEVVNHLLSRDPGEENPLHHP